MAEDPNASGDEAITALVRLGWMAYAGNGEVETATRLIDEALAIDPESSVARYVRASGLVRDRGDGAGDRDIRRPPRRSGPGRRDAGPDPESDLEVARDGGMSVTGRVLRWTGWPSWVCHGGPGRGPGQPFRKRSRPGRLPVDRKAGTEFTLAGLDGSEAPPSDLLRGDIVVVNFFASWCLECRNEHDDLVAASESFADQDVTFVQVAYQEEAAESLDYLGEAGASETTLYLADPGSRTAIAYGVFGIPETFFIDPDGRVVGKIIGEADALILGATIDSIRRGEQPGQQITGDTQQRPDA